LTNVLNIFGKIWAIAKIVSASEKQTILKRVAHGAYFRFENSRTDRNGGSPRYCALSLLASHENA